MKRWHWLICIGLCLLLPVSLIRPVNTLQIIEPGSGGILLALPVQPGSTWKITYIHSWYRVPQEEVYRLGPGGQMILEEMHFGSYSAALYYDENPAQGYTREDGWWKIKNINRPISQFRFKVGYTTDCTLVSGDRVIPFTSLAPPGHSLIFTVKKMTYGKYICSTVLERFWEKF